jgi:hypothetical protein
MTLLQTGSINIKKWSKPLPYLRVVTLVDDPLSSLISDDPVRPEIPIDSRIGPHGELLFLCNEHDDKVNAALCVKYCQSIPKTVDELLLDPGNDNIAVFYSVWSYSNGSGREIIQRAVSHIQSTRTTVNRFVTLSPKTDLALRFHTRNGAVILSENSDTVNYEYP